MEAEHYLIWMLNFLADDDAEPRSTSDTIFDLKNRHTFIFKVIAHLACENKKMIVGVTCTVFVTSFKFNE